MEDRGLGMRLLGGLLKGPSDRVSASEAVPRRGEQAPPTDRLVTARRATDRLAADRPASDIPATDRRATDRRATDRRAADRGARDQLAAALGVSPSVYRRSASPQVAGWRPHRRSAARPPLHAPTQGSVIDEAVPVSLAQGIPEQGIPGQGILEPGSPVPRTPAAAETDRGRHRRAAEQLAGSVPQPPSASSPPRHARTRRNTLGETVPVDSTERISAAVVPGDGRHRRPKPPKPANRLVMLGVLVLLVAVVVVFGVLVAFARSAAQPQAVAAASQAVAAAAHGQLVGMVA